MNDPNINARQPWEKIRNNIAIILVEPEHPGNIGSVARAMKTMGLSRLVLVNAIEYTKETYWLAHASEDILEKAEKVSRFEDLLQKFDYLIATSNRGREAKRAEHPQQLIPEILTMATQHPTGIVFGRENKGLYNSEIFLCRSILKIPAFVSYPSLNLAQAVMIAVYELYKSSLERVPTASTPKPATELEKDKLVKHFQRTLEAIKYYPNDYLEHWKNMTMLFRNFLNSGKMDSRHIRMMHKYFNEVENYTVFRAERENET